MVDNLSTCRTYLGLVFLFLGLGVHKVHSYSQDMSQPCHNNCWCCYHQCDSSVHLQKHQQGRWCTSHNNIAQFCRAREQTLIFTSFDWEMLGYKTLIKNYLRTASTKSILFPQYWVCIMVWHHWKSLTSHMVMWIQVAFCVPYALYTCIICEDTLFLSSI